MFTLNFVNSLKGLNFFMAKYLDYPGLAHIIDNYSNPVRNKMIEIVNNTKNILNYDLAVLKSLNSGDGYSWNDNAVTHNGVTYTINSDNSIIATGTSSSTNVSYIRLLTNLNVDADNYILTGCPKGAYVGNYRLYIDILGGGQIYDYGSSKQFTLNQNTTFYYVTISVGQNTIMNHTFYPMVCTLKNYNVDNTYVPYHSNVLTPSEIDTIWTT